MREDEVEEKSGRISKKEKVERKITEKRRESRREDEVEVNKKKGAGEEEREEKKNEERGEITRMNGKVEEKTRGRKEKNKERKIFGTKRDEVTEEWRKLHNRELHALYSSPDIIRNIKSRRLRWAGHVARMGESRNAYRVLVGRPEGKRPLGRPRHRWEDNIKMDLREVGYDDRDWINLAQDRDQWRAYVRTAMILPGSLKAIENLLSSSLLSKNLKVRIYKTVILPVLLYGCETWTLTLREEHRLRVFENKVLRKIFGAKRDEVTGEWRKLHNTELHALYSSPDIIRNIKSRRLRWAGHVARMGESRNAYRVLVGRPEGKRPLGRPRRRWEDNIKMDLREVGYDDRDWINLAQDRDRWRAYNKILRKIFGPIQENNTWRILNNRELRDIYKDPDITALIKSRRLRWLGHVLRRDEDSLLRKAFDYSPRCTDLLSAVKNLKVRIYKTVILPVVLYGCETWILTLREERRLRVFENKVLRKIFGAKRNEVTGEWRKLHNTELHALYSSADIIRNIKSRRLRWAGHVARMGESRNAYSVLVGRPEGKRLLGRPRRRWEDNIKMDLSEVGYDDRDGLILLRIETNGGLM
ncbi:hypothetical protein ANN_02061 [Periplaneta americana]|uniref:Endonuclease-reverse transcriptase n=1 Tax=Periplaneta americana TaxID=6978 RepID=A0ABQ8TY76_PERAM|nr:hypothetical protein ANN_02061 [Periplaneta americana]